MAFQFYENAWINCNTFHSSCCFIYVTSENSQHRRGLCDNQCSRILRFILARYIPMKRGQNRGQKRAIETIVNPTRDISFLNTRFLCLYKLRETTIKKGEQNASSVFEKVINSKIADVYFVYHHSSRWRATNVTSDHFKKESSNVRKVWFRWLVNFELKRST